MHLKQLKDNLYAKGCSVALMVGISDYFWAKYISSIAGGNAIVAGTWGAAVVVLGAFIVLSYVHDKRMIVFAGIGAFIGTYLAV
jgi:hypothetical protein